MYSKLIVAELKFLALTWAQSSISRRQWGWCRLHISAHHWDYVLIDRRTFSDIFYFRAYSVEIIDSAY